MNVPQAASELVDELAKRIGLTHLHLDDKGLCALQVGPCTVHIQADPAIHEFILFGIAGRLPAQAPSALLVELLQANRFWRDTGGATLSVDSEQPPRVILAQRFSWQGCTVAEFEQAFESFADHLVHWAESIGEAKAYHDPCPYSPPAFGFA